MRQDDEVAHLDDEFTQPDDASDRSQMSSQEVSFFICGIANGM